MKTIVRLAAFAAVAFTVHAAHTAWLTRIQPGLSTASAVRQLNGTDADAATLRWFETEKNAVSTTAALLVAGAALLCLPAAAPRVAAPAAILAAPAAAARRGHAARRLHEGV